MRAAQQVMAELAASGLSASQIALVMELSAAVAAEARPVADKAAENKRAYDREYRRTHSKSRTKSYEQNESGFPNERDNLTPPVTPSNSDELDTPSDEIELKPEHVVEVWNDLAGKHGLPSVKKLTPERRKKLNSFIRRWDIDDITEAIEAIPRSPFLLGQNDRGWQASFDWFLEPRNITKLTEGTYVH